MLFPILIAVLASVLAVLYIQHRNISRFWAERGVPYLPPLPLLGNFQFLFQKHVGVWMRELHEKFNAPYYGIFVFQQPVLVVSDPELTKRILMTDSEMFRDRYLGSGRTDPVGALNVFTINEPAWSNIRRRITHIFTAAKLKAMHGLLMTKSKVAIKRIKQDQANGKKIIIRVLFADYTTDIIGTGLFGMENDAVGTGDSPLRAVTRDFMKFNWFRGFSFHSIFFWPALVDTFRFKFFPQKSEDFFRKALNTIVKHRTDHSIENNDLVDALIKLKKDKLDDGQEFSDDMLAAQGAIMLQAGFDTTAVSATFIVYELAHNPKVQEKLYQELKEAKKNKGGDLQLSDFEKLTYLQCVIKEGLRRYAPMGWLDRVSGADYKIDDSLTIPAKTPVYINASGMHHDAKLFPEPFKFNPDRFLPENQHNIVPFSFLAFGDGPRMCIGKRFAEMTIRYLLSELVLNMEVRPWPGSPLPEEVTYETKSTLVAPDLPLSVEFIPRNLTLE